MACHGEARARRAARPARTRELAVAYPPYTRDVDWGSELGHKTHNTVACTRCHEPRRDAAAAAPARHAPHARCAGCHDGTAGKGPAMTACERCHTPAAGAPVPVALVRTSKIEVLVTSAFSHARHAARGGAGGACATCHAPIAATDDRELPRPTAATCAIGGCHDGARAFPVTAACTRCHQDPPASFKVSRKDKRYVHAVHERVTPDLTCAGCHPLAPNGEVRVAGHAPCAACHADDFHAREPDICGACHNATEPWRKLVADRPPPDATEFGATLDHARAPHQRACRSCHALTTASAELRPPRGHAACTGDGCHAPARGPAPRLATCEGCHARGLATRRQVARAAAAWSVRARFRHATHARAPGDGGELPCERCHTTVAAPDVLALPAPAKATCAGCHDGAAAFKLTGTTCTRCHQGARAP